MALNWTKHDLPTRQEKEAAAKKQQEHEQLPDRVAEIEDALCEQDAATDERMGALEDAVCEQDTTTDSRISALEDAVCELDAAINNK